MIFLLSYPWGSCVFHSRWQRSHRCARGIRDAQLVLVSAMAPIFLVLASFHAAFFLTTTLISFFLFSSFLPVLILYYLLYCTSPRIYSSFDEVPSTNPSLSFLVQQITAWYLPRYCTTRMSFSFFLSLYPAEYRKFFFGYPSFPLMHTVAARYTIYYIYIYLSLRRGVSEIKTCSLSSPI